MIYKQVAASRKRAQSYEPGVVTYAKTEGELRAASGTDHGSHIKDRKSQKKNEKKNRKRSVNPATSASLSATGSSIIPKEAQILLDNDNKETLNLGSKNSKADLIAELKARNSDTYAKVKSGPKKGNPTNAVTITMLTSILKADNGGVTSSFAW